MKSSLIPIDEIGPVIGELIMERWPHGDGYEVLAEKVGCDPSTIYNVVLVERDSADFNLIDELLCALGRVDMWRGKFSSVYYKADLRTVVGVNHGTDTAYDYHRCRCDYCRHAKKMTQRRRSGTVLRPRMCEFCRQMFSPRITGQRFCGQRCISSMWARNHYERIPQQERTCGTCGEAFTPKRKDGLYCSKTCASKASYLRKGGAAYKKRLRAAKKERLAA